MRVANKKLQWNVIIPDYNKNNIRVINIFNDDFKNKLYKQYRYKKIKSYTDLKDYIKSWSMYHFWSKCEWEMLICNLSEKDLSNAIKIDVYNQIEINLDRITEYVINELKIQFK